VTAPVFYAPELTGDEIALDGTEGHHAAVVRRLRVGEAVDLTDGRGTVASCRVSAVSKSGLRCRVLSVRSSPVAAPRFVVVQALPKGDRGELAVELLTEIGVDEIVPWAAARCVARWQGERGAKALARWRSSAREAAKQSRRAWFPVVSPLASTADVCALLTAAALPLVLHAPASTPISTPTVPDAGDVVLVVGPEGGLSEEEVALFAAVGAQEVRLGTSILRTSTAGIAAVAALMSRTGRWA
jgi:16S rRNA (uracil1498-N3)-methyltransferase